ncbi:MAG: hypothetical protein M9928_17835 [Anaerolineae bacterium]|nr:hypothetical protein [Anaerolineae bacterium]
MAAKLEPAREGNHQRALSTTLKPPYRSHEREAPLEPVTDHRHLVRGQSITGMSAR